MKQVAKSWIYVETILCDNLLKQGEYIADLDEFIIKL